MADNTQLSAGTGGDLIATDELTTLNGGAVSGVKVQRLKIGFGSDGTFRDVDATNGLPVELVAGATVSTSGNIAAGGTGTIGPLDVTDYGNVTFVVKNQTAASAFAGTPTLVFEQSDDGTSWAPLMVKRDDTGGVNSTWVLGANTANSALMFDASLEGCTQVRVRVTAGPTTNPMTVVIRAGALPFMPHMTVLQRHNAGRTPWSWYVDTAPTGSTTAGGTAFSMIANTGLATAAAAANYNVPAGKTLRITSATFALTASGTTLLTSKIRLHAAGSGTASVSSPIFLSFPKLGHPSATLAANEGGATLTIEFPDGLEFTAGQSICLSHQESTAAGTVEALLVGHLY